MQRQSCWRAGIWLVCAVTLSFCAAAQSLFAQGTRTDYERANKLAELTRNKVFRSKVEPHWRPGGSQFWYRNDLPRGERGFVLIDAEHGTRMPAFDHEKLAAALAEKLGRETSATRLPFDDFEFVDDGDAMRFTAASKTWRYALDSAELSEVAAVDKPSQPTPPRRTRRGSGRDPNSPRRDESPDGKFVAIVRDHNLFVRVPETGEEFALSTDGKEGDAYERGVFWSPDSSHGVALRTQPAQEHKVFLVESSPPDQLQPKLHSYDYLKPGDRIAVTKPQLFDVQGRRQLPVRDELFSNPWGIEDIRWSRDSSSFTFLYNQRGHQVLRMIAVNAQTGDASTVIQESSPTFIDYAHKRFTHHVAATDDIIWMSERDGWNHLYLFTAGTGELRNQITRGAWVVRSVDRVDDEQRQIWFRAGGVYPDQDPYYVHFCRVNFDGTGFTILTSGNGSHEIDYSPDHRFVVDTYSRVDLPPVTELRRTADGALVCELEQADWSALLATGWQVPERFIAKGRDGVTDIYGVLCRPTSFDAQRRYPVIELIYAGPQGSFVPTRFSAFHSPQQMAELGFVVVQIDGMGTSNRSKAFHDVCWKNLADSGFPDRILWLRAAADKYPSLDLTRIGIYGGSAGGQSATRALLAHGDFYKVAVSDCGCHDNRMDKVWWNELWMGYPIGPHYADQSNVTQAHKLQGKLLLIVGELDRNVDPASTMQVANALVKADKDFDLLIMPGAGHGSAESPYGRRRRQDFFVRHLLGVEPRSQP